MLLLNYEFYKNDWIEDSFCFWKDSEIIGTLLDNITENLRLKTTQITEDRHNQHKITMSDLSWFTKKTDIVLISEIIFYMTKYLIRATLKVCGIFGRRANIVITSLNSLLFHWRLWWFNYKMCVFTLHPPTLSSVN